MTYLKSTVDVRYVTIFGEFPGDFVGSPKLTAGSLAQNSGPRKGQSREVGHLVGPVQQETLFLANQQVLFKSEKHVFFAICMLVRMISKASM